MARPIEYNKTEVLNNAMETFWRYGYDSTSMKMLVESTGLTTRSMYNIFESKNGLFKAALDQYYSLYIAGALERLKSETGKEAITEFALAIADFLDDINTKAPVGCLFTNTMSEKNIIDDTNYGLVDDFFQVLEKTFLEKLQYATEKQGYIGDCTIRAKQLVTLIQGLSVYSKNYETEKVCRLMVEDHLELTGLI